jgi:hypothetical protein
MTVEADFQGTLGAISQNIAFTDADARIVSRVGPTGDIKFQGDPVQKLEKFELEFTTRACEHPCNLVIRTTVDGTEFVDTFALKTAFPLTVEERLRIGETIQLKLTNISDLWLFVSNKELQELKIEPGESSYLLHEIGDGMFSLVVRNELGEHAEKTWKLDEGIAIKRVNAVIDRPTPLIVGTNVTMELQLPACSYRIQEGPDFLVFGKTGRQDFEGGALKVLIVPVRVGLLESPKIVINDSVRAIHPLQFEVTATGLCTSGPLAAAT